MSKVKVFSLTPSPIQVPVRKDKQGEDGTKIVGVARITPGANRLKQDVWDAIKDVESIKVRIDRGHLKVDDEPSELEKQHLEGRPSKRLVSELSAKAEPIPTMGEQGPKSGDDAKIFE